MPTVPQPTIGPNGIVVPAQQDILTAVLNDMNAAFGGNLNTTNLFTPQGQLASSISAYIADLNALYAYFVSQTDPLTAEGFMQDAIGNLFGMVRLPATPTTVTGHCIGAAGTVIAPGSQIQDTSGNTYTTAGGTIGGGGSVDLTFTCLQFGPVPCPVGTLTRILTIISGWDSVSNTTGTDTDETLLGRPIESSIAFEARRQQSLFANAQSPTDSIYAAVIASGATLGPPNIPKDAFVLDNSSGGAYTFGGITLPPNSVYIAVKGGDPVSIATAIWQKKGLGASYAPSTSFTASIAGTAMTVSSVGFGLVRIGQTVIGAAPGATITAGPGTGGPGVYTVSVSQTLAAQVLTAATRQVVADTRFFTPAPTYNVDYTAAVDLSIYVTVNIVSTPSTPSNITTLVQNAIIAAFQGGDGGPPARIGATVYGTRFYSAIAAAVPGSQIASVFVGVNPSPAAVSYTPNINRFPVTDATKIVVNLL